MAGILDLLNSDLGKPLFQELQVQPDKTQIKQVMY